MVICYQCELWIARNWRQYHRRQANLRNRPDIVPNPCPNCGGTEWATAQPTSIDTRADSPLTTIVVGLAMIAATAFIMIMIVNAAWSDTLPYPKPKDGQCAGSFVQSGAFCVPKSGGTVRDSIPKPRGGQCPSGWASGAASCERMR